MISVAVCVLLPAFAPWFAIDRDVCYWTGLNVLGWLYYTGLLLLCFSMFKDRMTLCILAYALLAFSDYDAFRYFPVRGYIMSNIDRGCSARAALPEFWIACCLLVIHAIVFLTRKATASRR